METNNIDTVVDETAVVDDSPVVDSEIGTPAESSSSEESMVAEYEAENEITYYDQQDQENVETDLLTSGESGQALFRQIESDNFLNRDGSLTTETIAKAKAHGMSDEDINKHQDTILKQIDTQRNEMFAATGMSTGYVQTVVDWAVSTFNKSELAVFEADTVRDSKGSLLALEKYYQRVVVDGGAR